MSHVFISYSKKNRKYARKLADALKAEGFDIWIDDRIDYGEEWWDVIVNAIRSCAAFIVIMTPQSQSSKWVKRELGNADHWSKPLFPLLLDGENWPIFVTTQYADVTDGNLPPADFYDRLADYAPRQAQTGIDVTEPPPDAEPVDATEPVASTLDVQAAIAEFYSARDEGRWGDALDWLERIRESAQAPSWFDLSQFEREVRAEIEREGAKRHRREEEEAAKRARQEWEMAAEPEYAIIRVMAERDPARVWGALLGFWEAYPGYDPDRLGDRFWPNLPVPRSLPPPFEWYKIPAGQVEIKGQLLQVMPFYMAKYPRTARAWHAHRIGLLQVTPFYMAKYPVTYAQFRVFVDAKDGSGNPDWWEGLAADADHKRQPGDQRFKVGNHPRENVSWYDAVAFCRWLTARYGQALRPFSLREKGPGDEGWEIRLPTEWEWLWATQGSDGRRYPWGPEFDKDRCNTRESGIRQTTPVDQYPSGASPFDVMDMAGNVWEWCLNEYDNPTNIGLGGSASRVVRGGSWDADQGYALCTCRDWYPPSSRNSIIGFRVVVAPPISHK